MTHKNILYINILYFFYSSQANGNCLYSAISVYLIGHSGLVDKLRVLVCLELYLHSEFYASHPNFHYAFNFHRDLFAKLRSIFLFSVTHKTCDDSNDKSLSTEQLIKNEALLICKDKVWSPFICVLALSSVLKQRVKLHYPDFGPMKFKVLFNCLILPRQFYDEATFDVINKGSINLLYCSLSDTQISGSFNANHFVTLILRFNFKSKQSISGVKRAVSVDIDPNVKKIKQKHFSSPFIGKSIFDYFRKPNFSPSSAISSPCITSDKIQVSTISTCTVTTSTATTTSTTNSVITTSSSSVFLSNITSVNSSSSFNAPITCISKLPNALKGEKSEFRPNNKNNNITVVQKSDSVPVENNIKGPNHLNLSSIPLKDKYDVGFF